MDNQPFVCGYDSLGKDNEIRYTDLTSNNFVERHKSPGLEQHRSGQVLFRQCKRYEDGAEEKLRQKLQILETYSRPSFSLH